MSLLKQTFESFNPRFMKTKHTQGKWYLQEFTDSYTNIVRCDNGEHGTIFIASTPQSGSTEARANAKLIAAAPEMLEALNLAAKAWRDLAETTGEVGLLDEDVAYQTILSAINKAES